MFVVRRNTEKYFIKVNWHYCWRSRDELISDILLWTPTHGCAKAGRPVRTYIQQLCEDTGCCPEDVPEAMNDREKWRERVRDIRATSTTWWWWWWNWQGLKNRLIKMCYQVCKKKHSIIWTKFAMLKTLQKDIKVSLFIHVFWGWHEYNIEIVTKSVIQSYFILIISDRLSVRIK